MTFGTSARSAATARSWSGCSASTLPVQPINRVVVSLPAEAMLLTYTRISVRVRRRRSPCSSSNSASSICVMRSSDGFFARQSMYSPNSLSA